MGAIIPSVVDFAATPNDSCYVSLCLTHVQIHTTDTARSHTHRPHTHTGARSQGPGSGHARNVELPQKTRRRVRLGQAKPGAHWYESSCVSLSLLFRCCRLRYVFCCCLLGLRLCQSYAVQRQPLACPFPCRVLIASVTPSPRGPHAAHRFLDCLGCDLSSCRVVMDIWHNNVVLKRFNLRLPSPSASPASPTPSPSVTPASLSASPASVSPSAAPAPAPPAPEAKSDGKSDGKSDKSAGEAVGEEIALWLHRKVMAGVASFRHVPLLCWPFSCVW